MKLAKEAKAIYKQGKTVLVNCEIFERYLEDFKVESLELLLDIFV